MTKKSILIAIGLSIMLTMLVSCEAKEIDIAKMIFEIVGYIFTTIIGAIGGGKVMKNRIINDPTNNYDGKKKKKMKVAEYNGRVSKSNEEKKVLKIYQENEAEPIEITQSLDSCANCWNNRRCIYVDTIDDVKETCIFYEPMEVNEEPEYKEEGILNDYCSECSKERICKNARGKLVIKECGARTKNYMRRLKR